MASALEEDLCCPVCTDIFREPVALSCMHNFCKACLSAWWQDKRIKECPVCKARQFQRDPPCNLALRNLAEAFLSEKSRQKCFCAQHSEELKLFCLDHGQLVCVVCRDSKVHKGHAVVPINEAALDLKGEVWETLEPLQERVKLLERAKGNFELTAEHIKAQARQTETQIRDQFKKLHQFLTEEEEARVSAVREEEERKSGAVKDKMAALRREIETLSETVRATEEQLRGGDVSFLLNYKAAVTSIHIGVDGSTADTQLHAGALIDVAGHLGNLCFNIWTKMKDEMQISFYPVVLDPNTAQTALLVSEDLTGLIYKNNNRQSSLPVNPERLGLYPAVVGREGFAKGMHSWDVLVGDSAIWALGVSTDSKTNRQTQRSEVIKVAFCDGAYTAQHSADLSPVHSVVLRLNGKPWKIRVRVDCEGRSVCFSDADTHARLHTVTHTLTGKLFPYFNTVSAHGMQILPVPVCVNVKQ